MDDYRDVADFYRQQLEKLLKQAGFKPPDAYGIFSVKDRNFNENLIARYKHVR